MFYGEEERLYPLIGDEAEKSGRPKRNEGVEDEWDVPKVFKSIVL